MGQIEFLRDFVGRQPPGKSRQQVALLRKLLLKRRQQQFCLGERGILGQHVRMRHLTGIELTL